MASISTDKAGNRKIQFVNGDGKRKSVYLGKTSKADCKEICTKIEAILAATLSRRSLAPKLPSGWATYLTCSPKNWRGWG